MTPPARADRPGQDGSTTFALVRPARLDLESFAGATGTHRRQADPRLRQSTLTQDIEQVIRHLPGAGDRPDSICSSKPAFTATRLLALSP